MTEITPEQVLSVSATAVRGLFGATNWLPRGLGLPERLERLGGVEFVKRPECETDTSRKQVIPYVVLRCGDLVYRYTRGKAGSESRLHFKRSVGIGGHINPCDGCPSGQVASIVRQAAYREFREEVGGAGEELVRSNFFVGLVNCDDDAVSRVHVGVVIEFELYGTDIELREQALQDGRWVSVSDLERDFDRLERWSQICVREYLLREGVAL